MTSQSSGGLSVYKKSIRIKSKIGLTHPSKADLMGEICLILMKKWTKNKRSVPSFFDLNLMSGTSVCRAIHIETEKALWISVTMTVFGIFWGFCATHTEKLVIFSVRASIQNAEHNVTARWEDSPSRMLLPAPPERNIRRPYLSDVVPAKPSLRKSP